MSGQPLGLPSASRIVEPPLGQPEPTVEPLGLAIVPAATDAHLLDAGAGPQPPRSASTPALLPSSGAAAVEQARESSGGAPSPGGIGSNPPGRFRPGLLRLTPAPSSSETNSSTEPHMTQQFPSCPNCNSTDVRPEHGDRWQCRGCGHRLTVAADGTVRPWVDWMSAGRKPRGSGRQRFSARARRQ